MVIGEQVGFLVGRRRPDAPTIAVASLSADDGPEVDYVGPFRLLSVGDRLSRLEGDAPDGTSHGAESRIICVGIRFVDGRRELDGESRNLVAALSSDMGSKTRILAIVMHRDSPVHDEPSDPRVGETDE
jgi:hypothetical protein